MLVSQKVSMCCIANSVFNRCHTSSDANSLKLWVTSDARPSKSCFLLPSWTGTRNKQKKHLFDSWYQCQVQTQKELNMGEFPMKLIGTQAEDLYVIPWCITFTNAPSYPLSLKVLHFHFAPCLRNGPRSSEVIHGFLQAPQIRKIHRSSKCSKSSDNNLSMKPVLLQFPFWWLQPAKQEKKDKSAHVPATSGTGVAFSNRCESCIRSLARFSRVAGCKAMLDERNSYLPVW